MAKALGLFVLDGQDDAIPAEKGFSNIDQVGLANRYNLLNDYF